MIFITGDTHGEIELKRLSRKRWEKGASLSKKDFLIVAGDFGLIFSPVQSNAEKYWTAFLEGKQWTTLFVDGNHENHKKLNNLPRVEKFGGVVGKYTDNIFHLRRGEVYEIGGKKIFVFGGAASTDRLGRIEGVDWWPEEVPNHAEMENALCNLERHGNKVDTIITHTCPSSVAQAWLAEKNFSSKDPLATTERFLEEVSKTVEYKKWYFGHWHGDWTHGKHRMIYQDIEELVI